jgi:hypothetical protein
MKQRDNLAVYVEMRLAIDVLRPICEFFNIQVISASGWQR